MKSSKKVLGIIPARYDSSRFPGKPLADIGGKSMIRRVYERAVACPVLDRVVIATDDERILRHAHGFEAEVLMTLREHVSGTDRCAEVAGKFPEFDVCINIQGDEPFLNPGHIDQIAVPLIEGLAPISTLAIPVEDAEDLLNPNVVKVVFNQHGNALYFSRSPIPHLRGIPAQEWIINRAHYRHLGLYGFLRNTLLEIASLPPSSLERWESLEQLRWLEHGKSIHIAITREATLGVDTPEDISKALALLQREGQ